MGRWKQRRLERQLIGSSLEVIVSRMRYIASHHEIFNSPLCVCPVPQEVDIQDSGEKPPFLLCSVEELEPFVSKVNEDMLSTTVCPGVCYLHEELTSIVSKACGPMSSGMPLSAHLVVVMGAE
ncbi:hypothetical protein IFM89_016805 [Coptis chinensis]|uniref:Uncharacterized protein n=1 Tax=Coptis chinensis TaxID=261450 RepID=A0A835MA50_9MAGN|nr:hypothetical protein IFM89_016805 [Coptis chinensis]